ncbi:MAG: phasin family protein [Rhodospirillum sp.]|nr:phasin family protein [Rhodospirillum sp.]MCF8491595.1 phasin family protein [Rhodospirillum sp.]MCF8499504.1 phasin family protein [Rhodospirillum sp.]
MSEPTKPVAAVPSTPAKPAVRRAPAAKPTVAKSATTKSDAPKVTAPATPKPEAAPEPAPGAEPAVEPVAVKPTASVEAPASMTAGLEGLPVELLSKEALKAVEDVVSAGTVTAEAGRSALESVVRVGTDMASETYEKAFVFSKEQVEVLEKVGGSLGLGMEDGLSFLKANLEATGEATSVLVKGGQDLSILSFEYMKDLVEDSAKLGRDLMACEGPEKAIEVEMAAVEKAAEKTMAVGQKVADVVSKMLEESTAPLAERAESASVTLSKAFAVK